MNRYAFDPSLPGVLAHLKRCRAARDAGFSVGFTTDPRWLVHVAINRRAGWPDDPSTTRGSCRPLPDGRYPPRAEGSRFYALRRIARCLRERVRVYGTECPDPRVRARLASRWARFDD